MMIQSRNFERWTKGFDEPVIGLNLDGWNKGCLQPNTAVFKQIGNSFSHTIFQKRVTVWMSTMFIAAWFYRVCENKRLFLPQDEF